VDHNVSAYLNDKGKADLYGSIKRTLRSIYSPPTVSASPILGDMLPDLMLTALRHLYPHEPGHSLESRTYQQEQAPPPSIFYTAPPSFQRPPPRQGTNPASGQTLSLGPSPPLAPAPAIDISGITFPDKTKGNRVCHGCLKGTFGINIYQPTSQAEIAQRAWSAQDMAILKHAKPYHRI
jgi:hypothetical protein